MGYVWKYTIPAKEFLFISNMKTAILIPCAVIFRSTVHRGGGGGEGVWIGGSDVYFSKHEK